MKRIAVINSRNNKGEYKCNETILIQEFPNTIQIPNMVVTSLYY